MNALMRNSIGRLFRRRIARLSRLPVAALLFTAAAASAQNQSLLEPLPERGATPAPAQTQPQAAAAATTTPNPQLSQLFYQLQVLQQEVQELRGLVEEQSYQLNRLAQDQKEQYIDLDGRIAGLSGGSGPSRAPAASSTQMPGLSAGATAAGSSAGSSAALATEGVIAAGASERETYTRAFDLMKARQFEESAAGFNQLIVTYPNGQYTPNAFYWLGELYLAQSETEQARQAFAQVLNLYPDHPKVPDTLYKMGVVYHRLGDNGKAREYFQQVAADYPNSSAAGLATRYMAELQ